MNSFNSKVLFFGEYTILAGSNALAIPFSNFSGRLVMPTDDDIPNPNKIESNQSIKKWFIYLSEQKGFNQLPNKQILLSDSIKGLFFDSNIPKGYGVGSSGALTAAVYSQYFINSTEYKKNPTISLEELKADLSLMESYFHGTSSGIDPLVSYLNEPVLVKEGMVFKQPVKLPNDIKIFLIDTGLPATTGDLVPIFQNKLHNPSLKSEIVKMAALTDQIIEAFITNTTSFAMIDELTFHQQTVLKEMFLINKSLQEALNQFNGSLSIKLCGSGGGGFLLGFAKSENYEEITKYFIEKRISIITIEF